MIVGNNFAPRPASSALTKTGGFLAGFTHTLQPYIGCRFGCEYCYVKSLTIHRFHQPALAWGDYVHPRVGIAAQLRTELRRHRQRGSLAQLAIFMSSATDPYQGLERRWRLSRACLHEFIAAMPKLLVVQTRSPSVREDFELLHEMGERCWLNFTLETDLDDVRKVVTPRCPSIAARLETVQMAIEAGVNVQITVSPCLPFSSVESFGAMLLAYGCRIIVDTYCGGDGRNGSRTAKTGIPEIYSQVGWQDWRSDKQAEMLYNWLRKRIGDRVGWSQEGFVYLAHNPPLFDA